MHKETPQRYNSLMITLHWVMALAFFAMLGSGIFMEYFDMAKSLKFQVYQWHKSGGVLLLIAIVLRLLIKLASKAPPLPTTFKKVDKTAAKFGHYGLYLAMITMVTSGWFMVSSSIYGLPTIVFGWFEWPHIPNLTGNKVIHNLSREIHFYGFIAFSTLVSGHIGAVVLHYKKEKINLVDRMWWSRTKALIFAIFLGVTTPMYAQALTIDTNNSVLTFTGEHAGNTFKGTFNTWKSAIDLEAKTIQATFDAKSAFTGNPMYDGTLPTVDWFDTKNHQEITFKSTSIEKISDTEYQILGDFKIKNISKPLEFKLKVTHQDNASLKGHLEFTLNRLDYGLGQKSDPNADWVSQNIGINLRFEAY
jgi:cytochrome b561/polyisoprenoid-binding protein YceI